VDHQVEELFDFGLKAAGFLGCSVRHKMFQKGARRARLRENLSTEVCLSRPHQADGSNCLGVGETAHTQVIDSTSLRTTAFSATWAFILGVLGQLC
jgi:hypothetical protein